MKLNFSRVERVTFLERVNRFVIRVLKGGKTFDAYLPNPGRLWELLLPGAVVLLLPSKGKSRLPYTVVAVEKNGVPIIVHTHFTNHIVDELLRNRKIPGFEDYEVEKREVKLGNSRIDFLLRGSNGRVMLEIKTCTLFNRRLAMFPDAETARGRRHIEELKKLKGRDVRGGILFVVQWPYAEYFMPEFHVDIEFAREFLSARDFLIIEAISTEYCERLPEVQEVKRVRIPWDLIPEYVKNRGCYILVIEVLKDERVKIGSLGYKDIPAGYYIYVGRAKGNLQQRMAYHRRKRKKKRWHIDYLIDISNHVRTLPIRLPDTPECEIASALCKHFTFLKGFGASDCKCESHLFYSIDDPIKKREFVDILMDFRIGRIEDVLP